MKLQDVKNIIKVAKSGQEIIIENHICGSFASMTSKMGAKSTYFKPYTDKSFWSAWRIGIPYKWKGKDVVLWVRGYHNTTGDSVLWLCDSIWVIKTNKEMRKDAIANCWDHVKSKADEVKIDITEIKAKRIDSEDITKGWAVSHLGNLWTIEPTKKSAISMKCNSDGFWVKCASSDGRYAALKDTVKEAKAFIKYDSGEWLSSNGYTIQ